MVLVALGLWGSQLSLQFKMVCVRSEKPICAPLRPTEGSPTLPLKQFQCSLDGRRSSLVHQGRSSSASFFSRLSPLGDRWCDVLDFVPAGSVSSSSTLQVFREASHLWGLLSPPVYLIGHCRFFRHVQGNTPTGVFEGGCRSLTLSSKGFPLHILLFLWNYT